MEVSKIHLSSAETELMQNAEIILTKNRVLEKIKALLSPPGEHKLYKIIHDYHFGGYAKHPPKFIQFINSTWQQYQLQTDIVYTAKTFYAVQQMIANNTIREGSNVLMIHSGGLQGNLSLPANTLCF